MAVSYPYPFSNFDKLPKSAKCTEKHWNKDEDVTYTSFSHTARNSRRLHKDMYKLTARHEDAPYTYICLNIKYKHTLTYKFAMCVCIRVRIKVLCFYLNGSSNLLCTFRKIMIIRSSLRRLNRATSWFVQR